MNRFPPEGSPCCWQDGRFSVLAEALEASGYVQELRKMPGSLTILAPSDEAFQKIPQRRREKILNDKTARDGESASLKLAS